VLSSTNPNHEFIALSSTGRAAKRAELLALPVRTLTGVGARAALQRCPILRASTCDSNIRVNHSQKNDY
jgi:hypothetical protein